MSVQSSSVPTVTIPSITLRELLDSNRELKTINKTEKQKNKINEQAIEILEAEKTALNNRCTKNPSSQLLKSS